MIRTNRYNIPKVFERFEKANEHTTGGADISVSALIDAPQIAHLSRLHEAELTEDVGDGILRLIGTAIHLVLEEGCEASDIVEERYHAEVGGMKISGQVDRLELVNEVFLGDGESHDRALTTYKLQDWKTTACKTMAHNPEGKESWINQVNVYNFLAQYNGVEIDRLEIVAIFRDWAKAGARGQENYPECAVGVIPITMWPIEETKKYIEWRVSLHSATVPAECTLEDKWQSKPTYAVVKPGNKRATKVFNSEFEAQSFINEKMLLAEIEERPGRAMRCEAYCPVNQFCDQYKRESGNW